MIKQQNYIVCRDAAIFQIDADVMNCIINDKAKNMAD
jgi:hypothetical protein